MKVNYLRLLVEDFDACFDFYESVLGFKVTWGARGDSYASFQVNDSMMLSLYSKASMYNHLGLELRLGTPNFVLTLASSSVDDDYKTLLNKGVAFINEPHDVPGWGDRCVHLYDPEGNIIEINQVLKSDLWDEELKKHKDAGKILDRV